MRLYSMLTGGLVAVITAASATAQQAPNPYAQYPASPYSAAQQQTAPQYQPQRPQAGSYPQAGYQAAAPQAPYNYQPQQAAPRVAAPPQGDGPRIPGQAPAYYGQQRVAMQENGIPAPVEAVPAAQPAPTQAHTTPQEPTTYPAQNYSPAPTYSAAPAADGDGDCNCNGQPTQATPAANWEGYMGAPATGALCATGANHGYSAGDSGCYTDGNHRDAGCALAVTCSQAPQRQWFLGLYGLYMGRDRPGKATSTVLIETPPTAGNRYYPVTGTDTLFLTSEADVDFTGGAEIRFGSTFGCANNPCGCGTYQPFAWELAYWGLAEDSSVAEILDPDLFGGTQRMYGQINYGGIEYDRDGTGTTWDYRPVNDYYDYQIPADGDSTNDIRVQAVRVRQSFEVQNIELNFWRFGTPVFSSGAGYAGPNMGGGLGSSALRGMLGGPGGCGNGACGGGGCQPCGSYGACSGYDACGGCAPVQQQRFFINGLAGVRYLNMDETFRNAAFFQATGDAAYSGDMPTSGATANQVLFHDVNVDNNLLGFQLGCSMNCLVSCKWALFCDTNFGIYGNDIDAHQCVYSPGGGVVRFVGSGGDATVRSSKTDVAFLGEARCGVGYQLSPRCRLTSAYRVIAVSGVALAPSQIQSPVNEAAWGHIDSNDSIVIHGLQAGCEFKY